MALIRYFGQIADATGCVEEKISVGGINLQQLLTTLNQRYNFDQYLTQVAVNHVIVGREKDLAIKDSDEIALLPAYAGG